MVCILLGNPWSHNVFKKLIILRSGAFIRIAHRNWESLGSASSNPLIIRTFGPLVQIELIIPYFPYLPTGQMRYVPLYFRSPGGWSGSNSSTILLNMKSSFVTLKVPSFSELWYFKRQNRICRRWVIRRAGWRRISWFAVLRNNEQYTLRIHVNNQELY